MPVIRRGEPGDLAEIDSIQSASPEAPHWNAADYLRYDVLVAVRGNRVVGFIVSRALSEDEREILNLAVSPDFRRQGIARALCETIMDGFRGGVYLEVRESNHAARKLYESLGFEAVGSRQKYYNSPPEDAIVMKFRSC